eukprot:5400948-Pleurochrysis_carterae.AAC.1
MQLHARTNPAAPIRASQNARSYAHNCACLLACTFATSHTRMYAPMHAWCTIARHPFACARARMLPPRTQACSRAHIIAICC